MAGCYLKLQVDWLSFPLLAWCVMGRRFFVWRILTEKMTLKSSHNPLIP